MRNRRHKARRPARSARRVDRPAKVHRLPWLAAAAITACVAVCIGLFVLSRNQQPQLQPQPPTPPSETVAAPAYLNTGPEARYVGIDTCAECHRENHKSYLLTAHNRALADIDPKAEPPDGSFVHALSGRSYRIYRRGVELRHEEVVRSAEGVEISRVDVPMRYVVGSGHSARSYLIEVDGFLHQSPLTWYASKKRWDMSPSYDAPSHLGFERQVGASCLICHAGRVEQSADSTRAIIYEKTIGCESCHGPGSLHVERWRTDKSAAGADDLTVVNPAKLPRDRLESVCGNCHLNEATAVHARGHRITDFRPGTPLTDYRIDYRIEAGDGQMTVVGHIKQLRQSACYQKDGRLTCLTCHDPHAQEKPKDPAAFYRQKCLGCHDTGSCRLEPAQRLRKEPADNCLACHMPRGDTDIPHIAFTNHHIGRHSSPPPATSERTPALMPTDDLTSLSPFDRERGLGLAYVGLSDNRKYTRYADLFRERGRDLLEPLYLAGTRDGLMAQSLACVYWRRNDPARAAAYAQQALDAKDSPPDVRADSLSIRADCLVKEGRYDEAIDALTTAVHLRRATEDWRLLGRLYLETNRPQKALDAFRQAASIRPDRHDVQSGLAEAYRRLGEDPLAKEHQTKAEWLWKNRRE